MPDELEGRIDALYALLLDRFTPQRDALAKELQGAGEGEAAKRVKGLRKPVVAAWGLNALARENPEGIRELLDLGTRLRDGQRRALSGGDVEPLRQATDERRRLVGRLARNAAEILERAGTSAGSHEDDLSSTLDAAAVDEESGELLRSGRLTKPLQPPVSFGEPGLRVLEGGRGANPAAKSAGPDREDAPERDPEREQEVKRLRRELADADRRERSAAAAADRARRRYEELEARRGESREALRAAESEHRGVELDRRRLAARLAKLEP
ncbi:MAG: hypothetical protein WD965_10715 [Actinomycetota bacterium]